MNAEKQVLVFLLMGGALSLFYSACGLLWRALGKKQAVRALCIPPVLNHYWMLSISFAAL